MKLPQTIVYERNKDCELCGQEMNETEYNLYRGLEICPRCHEELEGKK